MKTYRLNRLFNPQTKRCFDVAVDHGFFGEQEFHLGIENLDQVVRTLVAAAPGCHPAHTRHGAAASGAAGAAQAGARPAHRHRQLLRTHYHRVVETTAGVPVLVRGGGKVTDREILARTEALLKQGAAGIVYGRNVIQHPKPAGITRALMALLHDGLGADAAFAKFLA